MSAASLFDGDYVQRARNQPEDGRQWRKRETLQDRKTGPKNPHSTVLGEAEEAMVAAFRRHTPLPLDDWLYSLQPSIPHLTRFALHLASGTAIHWIVV